MPNGTLGQALLPGWAPDATQLIHFYSWEQVPRAPRAASLEITLVIWPQALGEVRRHQPRLDAQQLQHCVLCALRGHCTPHRPTLTPAAAGAPAAASPGTPGQGHGAGAVPAPHSSAAEPLPPVLAVQPPGALQPNLPVHKMKNTAAGLGMNFFLPVLSSNAHARSHHHCTSTDVHTERAPTCPAAARSAASWRGRYLREGKKKKSVGAGDRKGQRVCFPLPDLSNAVSGTRSRNPIQTHSSCGCSEQTAPGKGHRKGHRKGALSLPALSPGSPEELQVQLC